MMSLAIPTGPLIAAYGEEVVNEILSKGEQITDDVTCVPAVEVFEIITRPKSVRLKALNSLRLLK